MAAGDRQVMKAMEEVTTNNVKAAVAHGNETRKIARELEAKVDSLDALVRQKDIEMKEMQKQIAFLLQRSVSGGT